MLVLDFFILKTFRGIAILRGNGSFLEESWADPGELCLLTLVFCSILLQIEVNGFRTPGERKKLGPLVPERCPLFEIPDTPPLT